MTGNRNVVFTVVVGLILIALGSLGLAGALAMMDKAVPDGLWTSSGTALGALGALLSRTGHDSPAPVEVINEPLEVEGA